MRVKGPSGKGLPTPTGAEYKSPSDQDVAELGIDFGAALLSLTLENNLSEYDTSDSDSTMSSLVHPGSKQYPNNSSNYYSSDEDLVDPSDPEVAELEEDEDVN